MLEVALRHHFAGFDLNVEFEAPAGLTALFGQSGAGKTSIINAVAGLSQPDFTRVRLNGSDISRLPAHKRQVGYVFQDARLFPHLSVRGNLTYGRWFRGEGHDFDRVVGLLGLGALLQRRVTALSGGERQRVAIGRAIVREPAAFLFDEPLSNLDAALRGNMRLEITELHHTLKTTMIYVTHDQVEAMTMADKIVVLRAGNVEQVGSPMELYSRPANKFVAGFIGSPNMNFIDGEGAAKHGAHTIGIRPEHWKLSITEGEFPGTVGVAEHLGSDTFLHIQLDNGTPIIARAEGEFAVTHGDRIFLTPQEGRIYRFGPDGLAA